ncbi:MAG: hypothetical protein RR840_05920 [Clostridium sp.]
MFIFVSIMLIVFPYIRNKTLATIDRESTKVVNILKKYKSKAIAEGEDIKIEFTSFSGDGYTQLNVYKNINKVESHKITSGFCLSINKNDLKQGYLVFRSNGTLDHRATTVRVINSKTKESEKITLTIGYTRIMRVE